MLLSGIAFYAFAGVATVAGLMVVLARNPVHSVLWLILAFFSAAGLFVLLGAELLAMLLVIVYVGAVMVLFLFVVMMLDVDFAALRPAVAEYFPIGGLVAVVLLAELGLAISHAALGEPEAALTFQPTGVTNAEAIGRVLYTEHVVLFQLAGLILLVAMVGAIVLTLRERPGVRRQDAPAPDPPHARRVDRAPGRASWRGDLIGCLAIGLSHYLTAAAILFVIGVFGIFLNRKNVIIILMSIELMLLAVNINLVAFSAYLGDLSGQIFAIFVLTVAAAEAAIGLAILVCFYRNRGSIAVEDVNRLRG